MQSVIMLSAVMVNVDMLSTVMLYRVSHRPMFCMYLLSEWHHNTQLNDTQHNIQHVNIDHAECYSECHFIVCNGAIQIANTRRTLASEKPYKPLRHSTYLYLA